MPSISLTLPTSGSVITAGLHASNYTTLQTLLNGGLDSANWAAGKIFDLTKLMQGGATVGSGLRWDGTNWVAATPEMAYVEFAANVTVTGTEGAPTDVVSAGAVAFDGATKVKVEFFAMGASTSATAGDNINFSLWDDVTDLGRIGYVLTPAAVAIQVPVKLERELTPSNASHTYKIRAWKGTNNGTVFAGAGGVGTQLPGFIRISRT